jgi:hypothetical protein
MAVSIGKQSLSMRSIVLFASAGFVTEKPGFMAVPGSDPRIYAPDAAAEDRSVGAFTILPKPNAYLISGRNGDQALVVVGRTRAPQAIGTRP